MKLSTHIRFDETPPSPGRKTKVFYVVAVQGEHPIGIVKFYPAWRKFCFFPDDGTTFDCDCLFTIAQFCEQQTRAHKDASKDSKDAV
jgi:hypothetical protein